MAKEKEFFVGLGWEMARIDNQYSTDRPFKLTIVSPACSNETTFDPAQSIIINGYENMKKLRDFLNQHIKDEEATK